MATYPCSIGMHRYGGAQKSAYVTDMTKSRPISRKLRLCQRHFDEVHSVADSRMDLLEEDSDSEIHASCQDASCSSARSVSLFAKFYPGGEDYEQFVGDYCFSHGAQLRDMLHWESGTEM